MATINDFLPVISSTTQRQYHSEPLQQATDSIRRLGESVKSNMFAIAFIIRTVDENKSFESEGFKSVHDWTLDAFGYKKTMSYNLLAIGRDYIRKLPGTDDDPICVSNLVRVDTPESRPNEDFTAQQISRVLPLTHSKVIELTESGELAPDMTIKEIDEVVKKHKPARKSRKKSSESSESSEPSDTPTLAPTTPRNPIFDSISTQELINELLARGYTVIDPSGTRIDNDD